MIPSGAGLFATGIHVPAAVARQGWATVKTVAAVSQRARAERNIIVASGKTRAVYPSKPGKGCWLPAHPGKEGIEHLGQGAPVLPDIRSPVA
jgi:hypothetical protein